MNGIGISSYGRPALSLLNPAPGRDGNLSAPEERRIEPQQVKKQTPVSVETETGVLLFFS
jgi:hypothetical protein